MKLRHAQVWLATTVVIGWAAMLGQAAVPATAGRGGGAATQPVAGDLHIALMDGSVVAGKLSVADIAIETKFGSLKVPVEQIQVLAPGLHSHPELEQRINSLAADLGADAFPDRENAQQALLKMGPELTGELQRQLKATPESESERQNRLNKILEDFEAMRDEDADISHDWTRDDVIVTPGFTIVGRITTGSFAVTSSYGTLQIKLADVREARRGSTEAEEIRKSVSISGNLVAQRIYTGSGVRLGRGDQVTITASGSIRMTPWGNNAVATPDGSGNYGVMQPGNIPGGTLIGRVGPGGPTIKVGSKCTLTADRAGVLEFGIAMPSDYSSYQFPGEYQVKIRVVKARTNP